MLVVAKIIRTTDRSENIDLFAFKTWFHFLTFMKHADGCSEQNKYQIKRSHTFLYPLLTLIFCSNYSSTHLWHSVSMFPENLNSNLMPCLLHLSQRLSFECTINPPHPPHTHKCAFVNAYTISISLIIFNFTVVQ